MFYRIVATEEDCHMGKMKVYLIFCLCITVLALTLMQGRVLEQNTSAASFIPQNVPPDTLIWQVLPSRALVAGQSFSLYTAPPSEYVVYGRRDYGINLVWTKNKPQLDNFTFSRASGAAGPIMYGDVLALEESTGRFIYYKERKYGINLEFSRQPVYEWEVRGGNIGKPVVERNWGDSASNISDVMFSLYNRTVKCYVGYDSRKYGINLVWRGGPGC
jgi:hypothetical protein